MAVIVPMYNEERLIVNTLRALDSQRFDLPVQREVLGGFRVVLVDNNSTDDTAQIVTDFMATGTTVPFEMITERQKGTGSAADAGARRAIELGATYIARTDADTLPAPDWLSSIIAPLLAGKRLVGGRVRARDGEGMQSIVFNAAGRLWRIGHLVEWIRTRNQEPRLRRSFAVVGNNLAIDAEMYDACGGFPRTSIEEADEDQVLQQRVRAITGADGIALAPEAIVYTSLRRLTEYGTGGFVSWYASTDRTDNRQDTDIR